MGIVRHPEVDYGPVAESENAFFLFALGDEYLTAESVRTFAAQTVPNFAKAMSRHKKRIIGVVAGKHIPPDAAQAARESGMFVLFTAGNQSAVQPPEAKT